MSKRKKIDLVEEFNFGRVPEMGIGVDEDGPYLSVNFLCPVPGFAAPAAIEETFRLHWRRHRKLNRLVQELSREVEATIKKGTNVEGNPCENCTTNCCSHYSDCIYVTHEDYKRITESGRGQPEDFIPLGREDLGYYGRVRPRVTSDGDDEACWFFDHEARKCSIQSIKPQVCRDYSAHECSLYEKSKLVRKS